MKKETRNSLFNLGKLGAGIAASALTAGFGAPVAAAALMSGGATTGLEMLRKRNVEKKKIKDYSGKDWLKLSGETALAAASPVVAAKGAELYNASKVANAADKATKGVAEMAVNEFAASATNPPSLATNNPGANLGIKKFSSPNPLFVDNGINSMNPIKHPVPSVEASKLRINSFSPSAESGRLTTNVVDNGNVQDKKGLFAGMGDKLKNVNKKDVLTGANIAIQGLNAYANIRSINQIGKLDEPMVQSIPTAQPEKVTSDYGALERSMTDDLNNALAIKNRTDADMGINDSNTAAAIALGQKNKINAALSERATSENMANAQNEMQVNTANAQMANQALSTGAQLRAQFNLQRGAMESAAVTNLLNIPSNFISAQNMTVKNAQERLDNLIKLKGETYNSDDLAIIDKEIEDLKKMLGFK